jgi:hypothetical protein
MEKVHYLLTRFNLNFSSMFDVDKHGKKTLTNEWMENRFELFDRYCFPSVKAQTNQNFRWLVLFDEATSEKFRNKIDNYKEYKNFCPLFINSEKYWIDAISEKIISDNFSVEYVITTRLDNDDAIHSRFMEKIMTFFSETDDTFIRFFYGYQWSVKNRVLTEFYEEWGNHYLSRIERVRNNKISTVLGIDNTKITELNVPIIDVNDKRVRLWIEVVHDENLRNYYRILKPVFSISIFSHFSLIEKINFFQSMKMYLLFIRKIARKHIKIK